METIKSPDEIEWIEGPPPDVSTVPYDSRVLAWIICRDELKSERVPFQEGYAYRAVPAPELDGQLSRIAIIYPHGDDLNPLRWCDTVPVDLSKIKYHAWITK